MTSVILHHSEATSESKNSSLINLQYLIDYTQFSLKKPLEVQTETFLKILSGEAS